MKLSFNIEFDAGETDNFIDMLYRMGMDGVKAKADDEKTNLSNYLIQGKIVVKDRIGRVWWEDKDGVYYIYIESKFAIRDTFLYYYRKDRNNDLMMFSDFVESWPAPPEGFKTGETYSDD